MAVRNIPQKSGRIRGHGDAAPAKTKVAGVQQGFMLKSQAGFSEGRTTRVASPSTLGRNRSNARRKPAARRTSPLKQMMRKQTISPEVARAMREQPVKGDRRRSQAQRKVRRRAVQRVRTKIRSGAITL